MGITAIQHLTGLCRGTRRFMGVIPAIPLFFVPYTIMRSIEDVEFIRDMIREPEHSLSQHWRKMLADGGFRQIVDEWEVLGERRVN